MLRHYGQSGESADMKVKALSDRFAELIVQATVVEGTRTHDARDYGSGWSVNNSTFLNWKVKVRNLLTIACGKDSVHLKQFVDTENGGFMRTSHEALLELRGVLCAAQEDYNGGFLSSVRGLVQAELFSDELEQASELLRSGYTSAAAVVAGVVLETTLRQMCADKGLPTGKLDKMNADLARAGEYSLLIQKRITTLADLRNNAAHGNNSNFAKEDVEDMIHQVERFITDHV